MPLPLSVCRLETADEVKCGNATDKGLAGEMTMGEIIAVTLVSICIMYPVFMLGYYIGLNSKHKDK